MQVLEDKDAIWRLFMEYKHHLDARDFKAYASLFTDDAVWVGNLGKAVGPAEIEALLVRTLEVYDSDRERTYHLVMNPVVDVDGDTATAQQQLGLRHAGRQRTLRCSRCSAITSTSCVRTPEGWKFQRREAYSDIPYISLEGII